MALSESIRENIFQDIMTSLQGIKGLPDYFNKIPESAINIIYGTTDQPLGEEVSIFIYPAPERTDMSLAERGKIYKIADVDIQVWMSAPEMNKMNTYLNRMLHDVEKALLGGTRARRGGYAIDTVLSNMEPFVESIGSPRCGFVLTAEIHYQQSHKDPTSE